MYYLMIVFTLVTTSGASVDKDVSQYPNLILCEIAKDRIIKENQQKFMSKRLGVTQYSGELSVTGSCTATVPSTVKEKK